MKYLFTLILTLFFMIIIFAQDHNMHAFTYGNETNTCSFHDLQKVISEGNSVKLQLNCHFNTNEIITKSMSIDLNGYNLKCTGGYRLIIAADKWLALKNICGTGKFSGRISFSDTDCILKIHSSEVLARDFSVDKNGVPGVIEIGDGYSDIIQTLSVLQTNINVKKVIVKRGAKLIIING